MAKEAARNRMCTVPGEIRWPTSFPHLSRRAYRGQGQGHFSVG